MIDEVIEESLIDQICEFGQFYCVRRLRDGTIIGLRDLQDIRAIYMDLSLVDWGRRFYFANCELASSEFEKIQTGNDEPTGWMARMQAF